MDRQFERQTPLGRFYGGILKDYPLARGGKASHSWLGLGNYEANAHKYERENALPEYALGLNFPAEKVLPNYYGEINTPLGLLFGGTDSEMQQATAGFQPNDRTNYYAQALINLLRGR
jgi:hypothetical protein